MFFAPPCPTLAPWLCGTPSSSRSALVEIAVPLDGGGRGEFRAARQGQVGGAVTQDRLDRRLHRCRRPRLFARRGRHRAMGTARRFPSVDESDARTPDDAGRRRHVGIAAAHRSIGRAPRRSTRRRDRSARVRRNSSRPGRVVGDQAAGDPAVTAWSLDQGRAPLGRSMGTKNRVRPGGPHQVTTIRPPSEGVSSRPSRFPLWTAGSR